MGHQMDSDDYLTLQTKLLAVFLKASGLWAFLDISFVIQLKPQSVPTGCSSRYHRNSIRMTSTNRPQRPPPPARHLPTPSCFQRTGPMSLAPPTPPTPPRSTHSGATDDDRVRAQRPLMWLFANRQINSMLQRHLFVVDEVNFSLCLRPRSVMASLCPTIRHQKIEHRRIWIMTTW